ncbi:MAG: RluA family pseudouridine synthase [Geminicoccaceae bacterium]|nr:RluA family pseudouridine synthase [Geminicoccaceae bacterium]
MSEAAKTRDQPPGSPEATQRRGRVEQRTVAPAEAGWRLDRWIRTHFPGLGFGEMQKLLRTGQFRVDGKRAEGSLRLLAGQTVRVPPLPETAREAPAAEETKKRPLTPADRAFVRGLLIYEDDRILAFNKPPGLAVQGGPKTTRHLDGLLEAFAERGEKPRLVHRLDRDTSGVVVVARTAEVARELGFAFQQRRIRKLYWAILVKGPERNEGEIELPLEKRGAKGREKVEPVEEEEEGRWAKTAFKVLARAGKVAAWVALLPYTGRTHQLRAHCAAIGAPILGDGKYGGERARLEGAPDGLMLHAREIEIPRPKGRPLRITAEPPEAFRAALAWLGLERPELPGARLDDWPEAR